MFFTFSLTASNTKRTNLTWVPLEIMYRCHTWHDYPWRWVSLTWLLFYSLQLDDIPGADFENSMYAFSQSEKKWWVVCIIIPLVCPLSNQVTLLYPIIPLTGAKMAGIVNKIYFCSINVHESVSLFNSVLKGKKIRAVCRVSAIRKRRVVSATTTYTQH